jgi:hypothetical protein
MSSRHILTPQVTLNAPTLTADVYGSPTNINGISICSYTIVWTGTPTGTFNIEVCNDYVPNPEYSSSVDSSTGSWVPLVLSVAIAATGSANFAFGDVDTCGAAWIRVHYVFSSGSGTAKATISGKSA